MSGAPSARGTDATLEARLRAGSRALDVALSDAACAKLLGFIALLERWNQAYNLTAVRDPAGIVDRHLLDALAVSPFLAGSRALDVGTGAGVPGLPLAVLHPSIHFVLIDSVAKKIAFVQQAATQLGLDNVEAVQARVEHYRAPPFDRVLARAFGSLAEIAGAAGHLLAPDGELLAMKGVYPQEELASLPPGYKVERVARLSVPGLAAARHVVVVVRERSRRADG